MLWIIGDHETAPTPAWNILLFGELPPNVLLTHWFPIGLMSVLTIGCLIQNPLTILRSLMGYGRNQSLNGIRWVWNKNSPPPLFSKGAKQGGILHNRGILVKNPTIFLLFWTLGAKKIRLISTVFLFLCWLQHLSTRNVLRDSCQGYFWKTTTSKRELSAPIKLVQNTSEKQ